MSIEALNFAFRASGVGSSAKLLLLIIADYAGEDNTAWPSIETLSRRSELDKKTIASKIKVLENAGIITVTRQHMKSNTYKINVDQCTKFPLHPKMENESLSINNNINTNKNNTIKDLRSKNGSGTQKCPHKKIVDLYNEILVPIGFRAVKGISLQRQGWLNARWKENISRWEKDQIVKSENEHLDWWKRYFTKVSRSDFLSGRSGDWKGCSFEWLIRPNNFIKVLEGQYDNKF